jgi:hypothetical protein
MPKLALTVISAVLLGLGATLTFDLWGLFLKHAFKLAPSKICLIGRWLLYMPRGVFRHALITRTPPLRAECAVGWIAHYLIGSTFALIFVGLIGPAWLGHPTLLPAIGYGVVTVLAPLFIMQPAFGFGWASARTAQPNQARWRSLLNHLAFGGGLYLSAVLLNWLSAGVLA